MISVYEKFSQQSKIINDNPPPLSHPKYSDPQRDVKSRLKTGKEKLTSKPGLFVQMAPSLIP